MGFGCAGVDPAVRFLFQARMEKMAVEAQVTLGRVSRWWEEGMLDLQLHGGEDGSGGEDTVVGAEGCGVSLEEFSFLQVAIGGSDCSW